MDQSRGQGGQRRGGDGRPGNAVERSAGRTGGGGHRGNDQATRSFFAPNQRLFDFLGNIEVVT